jgi:hypothetical protein
VANANDESGRRSFFAVLKVEDFVVARVEPVVVFFAPLFVVFFVAGTSFLSHAVSPLIRHKVPLGGSGV